MGTNVTWCSSSAASAFRKLSLAHPVCVVSCVNLVCTYERGDRTWGGHGDLEKAYRTEEREVTFLCGLFTLYYIISALGLYVSFRLHVSKLAGCLSALCCVHDTYGLWSNAFSTSILLRSRDLCQLFPRDASVPYQAVQANRVRWGRAHEALQKRGRNGIAGNVRDIFRDESIEREVAVAVEENNNKEED